MPRTKLIIIILSILAVIIAAANVFLWLNYQTKKTQIQKQITEPQTKEENIDQQIAALISQYDFAGPQLRDETTKKIIALGEKSIPALDQSLSSSDKKTRFIAFQALADWAEEKPAQKQNIAAILKKDLNDPAVDLKCEVAASLLYLGQKEGIPVLIDNFGHGDTMIYLSEPPLTLDSYILAYLNIYTDADFGKDKAAWQAWWQKNQNNLQWNAAQKKFLVP